MVRQSGLILVPGGRGIAVTESALRQPGVQARREASLATFALATAALSLEDRGEVAESPEARYLIAALNRIGADRAGWLSALDAYLASPQPRDLRLIALADRLSLSKTELLAVALAVEVEVDAMAGRVMAYLQAPIGGSRPTLGLLSTLLVGLEASDTSAFEALLRGPALGGGLLVFQDERAPLPERALTVFPPLLMALLGQSSVWPDAVVGTGSLPTVPLPPAVSRAGPETRDRHR